MNKGLMINLLEKLFLFLKIISPIIFGIILYFTQKKKKFFPCGFVCFICIISFAVSGWLTIDKPLLEEEVKLTALGQRGDDSLGDNVGIKKIIVGNKEYDVEKIVDGKWFWGNEGAYMWRNPLEKEQPDSVTSSITIKIPVGRDRSLKMLSFEYSGMVEVEYEGDSIVYDTSEVEFIKLTDSTREIRLLNHLMQYLVYLFVALIMTLYVLRMIWLIKQPQKDNNKVFAYVLFFIAILYLILVTQYAGMQSFWADELFQVNFSGEGKSLFETLMVKETTPPLYRLIANLWYRIVPYGEEYILFLNEIIGCITIVIVGYAGKTIKNINTGYISAILYAFSTTAIEFCAYEYRSYSLMCMLSAMLLLVLLVKYNKNNVERKIYWPQALIMVLLCYTHYFGLFLCMVTGLVELYIFIHKDKRTRLYITIPYIMCCILYLPWVFHVIQMKHISLSATWQLDVSFESLYRVLVFLVGYNQVLFIILISAIISEIAIYIYRVKNNENSIQKILPIISCILLFGVMAFYGIFVNTKATLWMERYFLVLLPYIIVIVAVFLNRIETLIIQSLSLSTDKKKYCYRIIILSLVICTSWINMRKVKTYMSTANCGEDFRGAANWLYDTQNAYIYLDSTAVFYQNEYIMRGWNEYYVTQKGRRDSLNMIGRNTLDSLSSFDRIYICSIHYDYSSYTRLMEVLDRDYELIETNETYKMYIYQRRSEKL